MSEANKIIEELLDDALAQCDKRMREDYEAGKLIIITSAEHPEQARIYQKIIHRKLSYEQIMEILDRAAGDPALIDALVKYTLFGEKGS